MSGLKQNKTIEKFINELTDYLKNNPINKKKPIIEEILEKNKLTTGNANSIIWKEDETILKYSEQLGNQEIYFVKDDKKIYWLNNKRCYDNKFFTVIKVQNGETKRIEIKKEDMPENIKLNDVFKIEKDKYIVDVIATKELQEKIEKMAGEIVEKQNMNLAKYRKEGHLYKVTEEVRKNRFLLDITDKSKIAFEEVDIPLELLDKATQGAILKYTNGKYEYYSNDGFGNCKN